MSAPRKCGACTLCCRLTAIPELNKQYGVWCRHCSIGEGCKAYEQRPPSCYSYECLWLKGGLPDNLRPDRCKVVFEELKGHFIYLVLVNFGMPDAWKNRDIRREISQLAKDGFAVVVSVEGGKHKYMLIPEGQTKKEVEARLRAAQKEISETNRCQPQPTQQI